MRDHEYALIEGVNRSKVGRYLTLIASSVSALIVLLVLSIIDIAKAIGLPVNIPPSVMSLIGASAVFGVLYWLFNKYAWKARHIERLLNVPNLSGQWECRGESLNHDGDVEYTWEGTVTIVQSWDRIRVRLKTQKSGSNSISAALVNDEVDGFRLLYNYRNDPVLGEPDLKSHIGFSEIVFDKNISLAEGTYYNGHGRTTFGRMFLRKING